MLTECLTTRPKYDGGCIMVWGVFSYHMMGPLILCPDRIDSAKYVDILEDGLVNDFNQLKGNGNNLIFI